MKVHNHGPNQGRGLNCRENLLGQCMVEEIEQKAVIEYMKSKEVPTIIVKFDDEKVEAIAKAWVDAGPHPDYHRLMQRRLRAEWPTLAAALDSFLPPKAK